ncbi:MAG: peptidyl-prolyl cis-trans isomerase, partial [Candidatus Omnitrophica bacterium]|nr:peptidyl-prolyl cis-trans isomerase [Candidatus Omnitrophota bacterium]
MSDEEALAFYEERKDQIVQPTEFKVREIVIKDKIKANEVLVDVLKGMDFAELAKLNSIGDTAKNGGDLGYITEEPFLAMAEQILALKPGETSNVFQGPNGYYIILLEDMRGGKP